MDKHYQNMQISYIRSVEEDKTFKAGEFCSMHSQKSNVLNIDEEDKRDSSNNNSSWVEEYSMIN